MSRIMPGWIDSNSEPAGKVLLTDGLGASMWSSYIAGAGFGRAVYAGSFFTSSSPYVEYSKKSWQIVNHFYFLGADVVNPQEFIVIGSRNGTRGISECRLYDVTNDLEMAYVSWTASGVTTYTDSTLQNVPIGRSVLSVQIKKDTAGASKTRLHSFILT